MSQTTNLNELDYAERKPSLVKKPSFSDGDQEDEFKDKLFNTRLHRKKAVRIKRNKVTNRSLTDPKLKCLTVESPDVEPSTRLPPSGILRRPKSPKPESKSSSADQLLSDSYPSFTGSTTNLSKQSNSLKNFIKSLTNSRKNLSKESLYADDKTDKESLRSFKSTYKSEKSTDSKICDNETYNSFNKKDKLRLRLYNGYEASQTLSPLQSPACSSVNSGNSFKLTSPFSLRRSFNHPLTPETSKSKFQLFNKYASLDKKKIRRKCSESNEQFLLKILDTNGPTKKEDTNTNENNNADTNKLADCDDTDVVSISNGQTLEEAIAPHIAIRGYSMEGIEVYLESSKTPLPLSSNALLLARSVLWVKAKRKPTSLKIPSVTLTREQRKSCTSMTRSKIMASLEDMRFDDGYKSKNSSKSKLHSLFGSFSKLNPQIDKQEQLLKILLSYDKNGLPKMPDLIVLGRPKYDPKVFKLENHWSELVSGDIELNPHEKSQQEAVWELLLTEVEYIEKLKVILDLFVSCLFNLQNDLILNEIEVEKLCSNITDVYYSSCHFWVSYVRKVLLMSRSKKTPLNPSSLKDGFLAFEHVFEPYKKFCLEQETCRKYIKDSFKSNPLFRTFILWAESQPKCKRLKLTDLIVTPFQRLTKYKLLLSAIQKPIKRYLSKTTITIFNHSVSIKDESDNSIPIYENYDNVIGSNLSDSSDKPLDSLESKNSNDVKSSKASFEKKLQKNATRYETKSLGSKPSNEEVKTLNRPNNSRLRLSKSDSISMVEDDSFIRGLSGMEDTMEAIMQVCRRIKSEENILEGRKRCKENSSQNYKSINYKDLQCNETNAKHCENKQSQCVADNLRNEKNSYLRNYNDNNVNNNDNNTKNNTNNNIRETKNNESNGNYNSNNNNRNNKNDNNNNNNNKNNNNINTKNSNSQSNETLSDGIILSINDNSIDDEYDDYDNDSLFFGDDVDDGLWKFNEQNSLVQKEDLEVMIKSVEKFVKQVNLLMRQSQDEDKLATMITRIEAYEPLDFTHNEECTKLISKYSQMDLTSNVIGCLKRTLVFDGPIRMKEASAGKIDVHCFIFSDMFLITRPSRKSSDKLKIVKPPMRLDRLVFKPLKDEVSFVLLYLNEFNLVQSVIILIGDAKLWVEALTNAQLKFKELLNVHIFNDNEKNKNNSFEDNVDLTPNKGCKDIERKRTGSVDQLLSRNNEEKFDNKKTALINSKTVKSLQATSEKQFLAKKIQQQVLIDTSYDFSPQSYYSSSSLFSALKYPIKAKKPLNNSMENFKVLSRQIHESAFKKFENSKNNHEDTNTSKGSSEVIKKKQEKTILDAETGSSSETASMKPSFEASSTGPTLPSSTLSSSSSLKSSSTSSLVVLRDYCVDETHEKAESVRNISNESLNITKNISLFRGIHSKTHKNTLTNASKPGIETKYFDNNFNERRKNIIINKEIMKYLNDGMDDYEEIDENKVESAENSQNGEIKNENTTKTNDRSESIKRGIIRNKITKKYKVLVSETFQKDTSNFKIHENDRIRRITRDGRVEDDDCDFDDLEKCKKKVRDLNGSDGDWGEGRQNISRFNNININRELCKNNKNKYNFLIKNKNNQNLVESISSNDLTEILKIAKKSLLKNRGLNINKSYSTENDVTAKSFSIIK